MVYYNEFDPNAAAWLRELIKEDLIPEGEVDVRSIEDVAPDDVRGFRQAHWFGGIGGWAYALKLAGWPDEWPVWTGSCPCQPYSQAGKRGRDDDPRALWWAWCWLIDQCRPPVILGEQVASADGRRWLAGVRADLEAMGYAVGAADLCAAGVGAPHIRQRLWWVAYTCSERRQQISGGAPGDESEDGRRPQGGDLATSDGEDGGVADPNSHRVGIGQKAEREAKPSGVGADGFWDDAVWIPCADGKARRIKPGLEPLVDGLPGRVALLRGAGNAVVPVLAAVFIRAYMEAVSLVPPQRAGASYVN